MSCQPVVALGPLPYLQELARQIGAHAKREAMKEFNAVVDEVIPQLAPELTEDPPLDPSFSQEKTEASFQKRLTDEKERGSPNRKQNPDMKIVD
jgi:hypothetical protein